MTARENWISPPLIPDEDLRDSLLIGRQPFGWPAGIFCGPDDVLSLHAVDFGGAAPLVVDLLYLTADGRLVDQRITFRPTTTFSEEIKLAPCVGGILLSAVAYSDGGNVSAEYGAGLFLLRNPAGGGNLRELLFSGITSIQSQVGWSCQRGQFPALDTIPLTLELPAPGAGANLNRLLSGVSALPGWTLAFTFATSGTVATRTVFLEVDDNDGDLVAQSHVSANQTASQTIRYIVGPGARADGGALPATSTHFLSIAPSPLPVTCVLFTEITNLQAGDSITNPKLSGVLTFRPVG